MAENRNKRTVILHKCRAGYKEFTKFQITAYFLRSCDIIECLNISLNSNQSGILQQRTRDVELKKFCVTLLEKFGSFNYTRQTLEELDAEARAEVAKLGGNPQLEDILNETLNWKGGHRWQEPRKVRLLRCCKECQYSSCVANKLICICYFDFNGCWEHDKGLWHTFIYMLVQHGHFLWYTFHIIFVSECETFYVKKYVNNPEG